VTGFAAVPAWVVDDETISQKAKLTYLVLSRHIGRDSLATTLSQGLIARKAGMSARSVRTALTELRTLGLVEWETSHRDDGGTSYNTYRMHVHPTTKREPTPTAPRSGGVGTTFRGGRQEVPHPPATGAAPYKEEPDVEEPDVEEPDSAADAAEPLREDVERVCLHLADRIEANGCKRPAITKRWRDAARLLMDRDGRTEQQVTAAIDWATNDEFWRSNILSMPKLRVRYEQLRLAAQRPRPGTDLATTNGHRPSTSDQRVQQAAVLADRYRTPTIPGA
jgi:hypothetical protein